LGTKTRNNLNSRCINIERFRSTECCVLLHIMCSGDSARTSQGGTIVLLKPQRSTDRPGLARELSLELMDVAGAHTTEARLRGYSPAARPAQIVIQYVISRDHFFHSIGTHSLTSELVMTATCDEKREAVRRPCIDSTYPLEDP
jgi:hypothetical protein